MTYTNKTQATTIDPMEYLKNLFTPTNEKTEKIYNDAIALIHWYEKISGYKCVMWNKIFGFGKYYYNDSKGGRHEFLMLGFAISSTGFTLYNSMWWETYKKNIAALGKFKLSGKSCLAIKRIADVNLDVLETMMKQSIVHMKQKYEYEN